MYAQDTFFIESKASQNVLNVFVGKSVYDQNPALNGQAAFSQSYVSGGTVSKWDTATTGSSINITNFEYGSQAPDNLGVARVTTTSAHGLKEGDKVTIASVSLSGSVTFPQTDRPDTFIVRRVVGAKVFEIFPGKPAVSELSDTTIDITNASYNPTSGAMVLLSLIHI